MSVDEKAGGPHSAMDEVTDQTNLRDDSLELARWLEESGRRKLKPGWLDGLSKPSQSSAPALAVKPKRLTQPALLWLLAFVALSYMQFFLIDVQLTIVSMPRIIVFIAVPALTGT